MKTIYSNILTLLFAVVTVVLQSCAPSREMAYITDAERDSAQRIIASYANSIHAGDQLYIYVYSETPESVIPFNQETHKVAAQANQFNHVDTTHRSVSHVNEVATPNQVRLSSEVSGYLVDEAGTIIFPILGVLPVAGLTYDSLAHLIEQCLIGGGYLNDPLVTVSPMNFRVSVMGEVRVPRELHITGERLTILEALAMCGDITIDGQRDNITVVRSKKGIATPITIDPTKKTIFDSEVYYLQSNDIVYVEPNKLKKRKANLDENWPMYATFGVALGAAVVNILRANASLWGRL